jgi:methionyl-tRNA formyltransferase
MLNIETISTIIPQEKKTWKSRIFLSFDIDWSMSALEILRLVNASNRPYAGAFCYFEDNRMIIWDADIVEDDEIFCSIPGKVTLINKNFIEVACGKGKIRLLQAEVNRMITQPSEWIKSIRKRLK